MNRIYCCFPGGKHKALTLSYDDGRTQDRRLVDIFNRNGIKGTFHLNSGLFDRGPTMVQNTNMFLWIIKKGRVVPPSLKHRQVNSTIKLV